MGFDGLIKGVEACIWGHNLAIPLLYLHAASLRSSSHNCNCYLAYLYESAINLYFFAYGNVLCVFLKWASWLQIVMKSLHCETSKSLTFVSYIELFYVRWKVGFLLCWMWIFFKIYHSPWLSWFTVDIGFFFEKGHQIFILTWFDCMVLYYWLCFSHWEH